MPLVDRYLIVDWSAANTPKLGKDSIWICEARRQGKSVALETPINIPTRAQAIEIFQNQAEQTIKMGQRLFAGFDFPFGYPAGTTSILTGTATGTANWASLWKKLHANIDDNDHNQSNRFDLAAEWNRQKFETPMYWGAPHQHHYDGLPHKKPVGDAFSAQEMRIVEMVQRPAKSVWQLAYSGAVGSQAMLGMARLEGVRQALGQACAVWPFETAFTENLIKPIILAEVYPSMFSVTTRAGEVKDAAQVRNVAALFARADINGELLRLMSAPPILSTSSKTKVLREEGWIVGAGHAIDPV